MNDNDRRAALEVHALAKQDREWILGRLDRQDRARIEPLLSELDAMNIHFDVDPAQVAGDPHPLAPVNGAAYAAPAADSFAVVRSASAAAVGRALQDEPQWLVERVLAIEAWPWSPAVRAAAAEHAGRGAGLRVREPSTATTGGPALNAALVELLSARVGTSAPGSQINGYRNGHDHAHVPRSRLGRVVSGVRQWLP